MNVDPFFVWLEATALSTWIRESDSLLALPGILTLHTLAMGWAKGVPPRALHRLVPIGVSLLIWVSVLIAGRMEAFVTPLPNVTQ